MTTTPVKRDDLYRSERGMVAIMVTLIMIIVISLIVLGFAQLIRRNQRQALDRQLSTQAFYAAESGVNDVRKRIQTAVTNGEAIVSKNTCGNSGGPVNSFYYTGADALQPNLDIASAVKYVCVLVDATPDELSKDSVDVDPSTIMPLTSSSGGAFQTIQLEWAAKDTSTPLTGCPASLTDQFRPDNASGWTCGYGVLRFDLVPTNSNSMDINSLSNSTMTSFAVPFTSGGESAPITFQAGAGNTKGLFGATCTNVRCTATINVASVNSDKFHLRVTSVYKPVSLKVRAALAGGVPAEFAGVQAVIDSTGKAQDIARRIKVTVPIQRSTTNGLPDYALRSSDSICKRFAVMDNYFAPNIPTITRSDGTTGLVRSDPDNLMCTAP